MGIEAIGSIGSAIGSVGPALASFGEVMKAPIGNIVNEGPVRGGFLEGFRPMNISDITTINTGGAVANSPLGEILFKSPTSESSVIQQAESVAAVAWGRVDPITPVAEPGITREAVCWFTDVPGPRLVRPAEVIMPLQTKTENRVSAVPAQAPAALPQLAPAEQEVEEIVEEKVEKQKPEERLEEVEEIERQMYLEDESASAQRKIEIRKAVVKARTEADRLGLKNIAGWLVAKFLPGEHEGNRSQVVRKTGPDGSYQETIETISGSGDFESEAKAVERFNEIVAERKPVKYGKNGTPVGNIDIARVFKYRLIKPIQAYEEVVKRVIKKKVLAAQQGTAPTIISEKKAVKTEASLEELNPALAEVFQRLA